MGAVWENPAAAAVPGKYRWCLNMAVQYKRILLKVSGEALSGEKAPVLMKLPLLLSARASRQRMTLAHRSASWLAAAISGAAVPPAKWIAWMQTRLVCWQP